MIDIQYLSIPLTKDLSNLENNKTVWYPIKDFDNINNIDDEIKKKVKYLCKKYNKMGIINK